MVGLTFCWKSSQGKRWSDGRDIHLPSGRCNSSVTGHAFTIRAHTSIAGDQLKLPSHLSHSYLKCVLRNKAWNLCKYPFRGLPFHRKTWLILCQPQFWIFFISSFLRISQPSQTLFIPTFQMLQLKGREVRWLSMVTLLGAEEQKLNAGFSIPVPQAHREPTHAPATTSSCVSAHVLSR